MKKMIIFLLLLSGSIYNLSAQDSVKQSYIDDSNNKAIYELINSNRDIIAKCIFSIESISNITQAFDINKYDSIVAKIATDTSYIYGFICSKTEDRHCVTVDKIRKWCYCYRVFESLFVFNNKKDFYYEDIATNIPILKKILKKYVSNNQTINAMTTSQSEMFFLESVTVVSRNNPKAIAAFFEKYFGIASKKIR